MKKFLLLSFLMVFGLAIGEVWAQERTVSGKVTSMEEGDPLPGVNVVLKGTTTGTVTDIDGNYKLTVPSDANTLVFSFIGLTTQEISIGGRSVIDVQMRADVTQLAEVVVTGVATGTSTKKLGFALSKIDQEALEHVPATDPGNALRGKAAGVRVVQPSGNPSTAPEIRLRGSSTINGSQSPLIIVDGIITNGSLNDINMDDVESMEVIKGAAASSLYGSLAGNGVVQIITKRGRDTRKPQLTIRSEYGVSELARQYPISQRHAYLLDSNGDFVIGTNGTVVDDPDGLLDNPYPRFFNNAENLFGGNGWWTNSVSLAGNDDQFNFYLSFQNLTQEGVIEELPDYNRNNARVNLDYTPNDKLKVNTSISFTRTDGTNVDEQGQSPNIFYGALIYSPYINLAERDENGDYVAVPDGFDVIPTGNFRNPLYQITNFSDTYERERILGRVGVNYKFTDWFTARAAYSLDRTNREDIRFYPKGYETAIPNASINNGFQSDVDRTWSTEIAEIEGTFQRKFDKLNAALTLKYLYEDRVFESQSASSYDFIVKGVETLDNAREDTYSISSTLQPNRAENVYANIDLDYDDKIIVNGLIRRDGSSLFGEEERYQIYYRGSIAYRLTEDMQINNVNEWKIRASYGTSGLRPYAWAAQYETFSVTGNSIRPVVLGNKNLKPSVIQELEVGTDVFFLDRFNLTLTYADSKTEDDLLFVPLSPVTGYIGQYQNAASLESNTFEASLTGEVLKDRAISWNFGVYFDRTRQTITDLETAPFTRNTNTALNLFRVEEGLPYGTIFGATIVTSFDQLITDENGFVINDRAYASDPATIDQFMINEDGYVVRKDYYNTSLENSMLVVDETGNQVISKIGDTNPDFSVGGSTSIGYKGLNLYVLVDWKKGGDVYNYTKQLLYFDNRHLDQDQYAEVGKHMDYSGGASTIYNLSQPVSHFVEDGSYVKIREVALSYDLPMSKMGAFGEVIKGVTVSISGRNLLTFTEYSGWDPEVAINENPTNFLIDEFSYPNFRTYTGSVKLRF